MDRTEKQKKILDFLCDTFNENDMQSVIDTVKAMDKEIDILRVDYRGTIGDGNQTLAEFYFMDTELSSEDAMYLNGIITLKTNVEADHYKKLADGIYS